MNLVPRFFIGKRGQAIPWTLLSQGLQILESPMKSGRLECPDLSGRFTLQNREAPLRYSFLLLYTPIYRSIGIYLTFLINLIK